MLARLAREAADEWLHRYPGSATVMAYIGRSGWNDLAFGGAIPDEELVEAVDAIRVRTDVEIQNRRDREHNGRASSPAPRHGAEAYSQPTFLK